MVLNFKETLIMECKNMLKRDDIKDEIKAIFKPIIDMILKELYPYILLSVILVIISFMLILGIFIILLRNNNFST
jgi:hypothetical protein